MSASSTLKSVIERIETQLQAIDGQADNYYFNISHKRIKIGYELLDQADSYPCIYISSPSMEDMRPTDQRTYEGRARFEIFGYVEKEQEPTKEAIKLFSDIEKALFADPELNDLVWGLQIDGVEIGEMKSFGGILIQVSAMLEYNVTT